VIHNGNGDGSIEELRAVFSDTDLVFRHLEDSRVPFLRWQAGRMRCIECECEGVAWFEKALELVCYASTSEQLIDKLAYLPNEYSD
jgi:hypothetical protein